MVWSRKVDAEDKIRREEKIQMAKVMKVKGIALEALLKSPVYPRGILEVFNSE